VNHPDPQPNPPRFAQHDPKKWRRRAITLPGYALVTLTLTLGAPFWVPVVAVRDAVVGTRWSGLRFGFCIAAYFQLECIGLLAAGLLWLRDPTMGDHLREPVSLARHHRLQAWWGGKLFGAMATAYQFRVIIEDEELLDQTDRPLLVFSRHASIADTILPASLLSDDHGWRLRYVIKSELRWDPCLDVVGARLPNHFVDRSGGAGERAGVGDLARGLLPHGAALIFPEGTRYSPERRERQLKRLREAGQQDDLAHAEALQHTLLPRPGGVLALLENNPEVDVLFFAHHGFDRVVHIHRLLNGELIHAEIRMKFWRVSAADIPTDPAGRKAWLFDWWATIDAWIGAQAGD